MVHRLIESLCLHLFIHLLNLFNLNNSSPFRREGRAAASDIHRTAASAVAIQYKNYESLKITIESFQIKNLESGMHLNLGAGPGNYQTSATPLQ